MENILQIKIKLEDQAKNAYSVARARLTREEEKLEKLEQQKNYYEDYLRDLRSSKLNILEICNCEKAIDIMKIKIDGQKLVVEEANKRLEAARIKLQEAMAERKTQEKLKEKAFEAYMLEFEAEEQKEADELNSFRFSNIALGEEDK